MRRNTVRLSIGVPCMCEACTRSHPRCTTQRELIRPNRTPNPQLPTPKDSLSLGNWELGVGSLEVENAATRGDRNDRRTVVHTQLVEDVLHMHLGGLLADSKRHRNLLV